MVRTLLLGAVTLSLLGCGGGGGDDNGDDADNTPVTIASGTLTGKVGGAAWTLALAQTDAFLSEDETFWVDAYAQGPVACGDFGSGNRLILNVPKQVGTRALSLALNGTFVIEGAETQNLIATQGAIRVDEITSTMIRGGVTMTFDADNSVSGEFSAAVCAQ